MLSMIWQDMRITGLPWQKAGLFGLIKEKDIVSG